MSIIHVGKSCVDFHHLSQLSPSGHDYCVENMRIIDNKNDINFPIHEATIIKAWVDFSQSNNVIFFFEHPDMPGINDYDIVPAYYLTFNMCDMVKLQRKSNSKYIDKKNNINNQFMHLKSKIIHALDNQITGMQNVVDKLRMG